MTSRTSSSISVEKALGSEGRKVVDYTWEVRMSAMEIYRQP